MTEQLTLFPVESFVRRCCIEGCEKEVHNVQNGWCGTHYARWIRNGDPLVVKKKAAKYAPDGTKLCPDCEEPMRPEEEESSWVTPRVYCKECALTRTRRWRKTRTPEQWAAYRRRATIEGHGMTEESYAEMLAAQGGGCKLCKSKDPRGKGVFHIDHDHLCCPGSHSCGKCVRGLLCHPCNSGMGSLNDDPALLRAAADYIEKFREGEMYCSTDVCEVPR